jgi:hypothetical protein
MESKGLKINAGKTKAMMGGEGLGKVEVTCKEFTTMHQL